MGSVICSENYFDNEGNLVSEDDDENEMDDDDDPNEPEDEDDDCEDDFGSNITANVTYKFSEKVPFLFVAMGDIRSMPKAWFTASQ